MTSRRSVTVAPIPSPPSSSDGSISKMSNRFTKPPHSSQHPPNDSLSLDEDPTFDRHVVDFLTIKNQPFAVSGRIPFDSRDFTLFFRTCSGTSHSIDFPLDPEDNTSAAFEILLETCKVFSSSPNPPSRKNSPPHHSSHHPSPPRRANRGPYVFPPNLPLTTTFDISSHPIIEAVKDVLFPNLPSGYYLTADRASLELTPPGSQSRTLLQEETPPDKVATLVITLPVRFRGGALVITHPEDKLGIAERYRARGGKPGHLEWTAFLSDANYGVEPVERGCRVTLSYNIKINSFGPTTTGPGDASPLILSNDRFLDAMTPLFARAKGVRLGFFTSGAYPILPSEVVAETLASQLKGGDMQLFNAAKLYGFNVEFRYAAGGYIWSAQQTIQLSTTEGPISPASSTSSSSSSSVHESTGRRRKLSVSLARNQAAEVKESINEGQLSVKEQVLASGALRLADAGVHALTALSRASQGPVTRLPVPFVADGGMNRLWVNVLMVIWRA